MSSQDQDMTERYADGMVEGLDLLFKRYDLASEYADRSESAARHLEEIREEIEESPLELVAEKGEPFSILLGFGGPNVRIEWSGRRGTDAAVLNVDWWFNHADRRSEGIRRMAEYFEDWMMLEED